MCRLAGLHSSRFAARICAAIINSFAGTSWVMSPRRCASAASMIFPERSRSRARFLPIWRTRKMETTAGRKPMRTSGYPNFASGTAKREIAQRRDANRPRWRPIHSGDSRLWKIPDSQEETRQAICVFALLGGGLHGERLQGFQVHAGTERFSGAGQYQIPVRGSFPPR